MYIHEMMFSTDLLIPSYPITIALCVVSIIVNIIINQGWIYDFLFWRGPIKVIIIILYAQYFGICVRPSKRILLKIV